MPQLSRSTLLWLVLAIVLTSGIAWGWYTGRWGRLAGTAAPSEGEHADGHDHGHADADVQRIQLSPQAREAVGLSADQLTPIKLTSYLRSVTVPGVVVERSGRSRLEISTPMAGVITRVYATPGTAVIPGETLFEIRITGEELVSTQTAFLKTLGELDVEDREITRLTRISESGAVPQKSLLERKYAREKLVVLQGTQREALRLHGFSDRQIDDIADHGRLLRDLKIVVPRPADDGEEVKLIEPASHTSEENETREQHTQPANVARPLAGGAAPPLVVEELVVHRGESVADGTTLAVLADYAELHIEGRAFEQDASWLTASGQQGWKIAALFDLPGGTSQTVEGLELVYSASAIDAESRSLRFYVRLPNEIVRDVRGSDGQRYIDWKYRKGQRLRLRVPVEQWRDVIVLPLEAVARDGVESFVFKQNGSWFEQVAVRVVHRDATQVVIAGDGAIFPGDVVARRGAHQLHMAIKNQAAGPIDPHAGHSH